ncbi:MAG TPA: hypothetical protein VFQ78_11800, partial [Candidatus Udaeobacter sp.]|nr:hypothetical protein [Candidatus Udaeobacter sp.]
MKGWGNKIGSWLFSFLTLLGLSASPAATFDIADGDVTALVNAITTSNTNGQNDTINLADGGTYILTSVNNSADGPNGLPIIQTDGGHTLVINGRDSVIARNTVMGTANFRVLNNGSGKVTLVRLLIGNGQVLGATVPSGTSGGGIFNRGTLTLKDCTVSSNSAVTTMSGSKSAGGGLFNFQGTLNLDRSSILSNSSTGPNST